MLSISSQVILWPSSPLPISDDQADQSILAVLHLTVVPLSEDVNLILFITVIIGRWSLLWMSSLTVQFFTLSLRFCDTRVRSMKDVSRRLPRVVSNVGLMPSFKMHRSFWIIDANNSSPLSSFIGPQKVDLALKSPATNNLLL